MTKAIILLSVTLSQNYWPAQYIFMQARASVFLHYHLLQDTGSFLFHFLYRPNLCPQGQEPLFLFILSQAASSVEASVVQLCILCLPACACDYKHVTTVIPTVLWPFADSIIWPKRIFGSFGKVTLNMKCITITSYPIYI